MDVAIKFYTSEAQKLFCRLFGDWNIKLIFLVGKILITIGKLFILTLYHEDLIVLFRNLLGYN